MSDIERELGVFPPPGDLWRKIAASKSVAVIIGSDLSADDDAFVADLLGDLIAVIKAIRAAAASQ